MELRRGTRRFALTVLALSIGHVPTSVAVGAAAVITAVLAAVLLAPDPRSVPQRMLLLLALLQRADPGPWLDPPRAARTHAAQPPDSGRDAGTRAACGKAGDGCGADARS